MLKFDKMFELLKQKGYTTYRIRQEKIIGENALTAMRNGGNINSKNIDAICRLLECQPGDILEWVPDTPEREESER